MQLVDISIHENHLTENHVYFAKTYRPKSSGGVCRSSRVSGVCCSGVQPAPFVWVMGVIAFSLTFGMDPD